MSFWTKLTLTLLITVCLHNILMAQNGPVITIMGKYEFSEEPILHTMEFSFVENGITCGPNAQFESIDEQYSYFIYDIIKNDAIAARIKLVDKIENYFTRQPIRTYSFAYNTMEEVKMMYKWAKEGFAEKFKYFTTYKLSSLEDQDKHAIGAYEIAREEALSIAKLRGYNDVKLISIDDNTGASAGLNKKYSTSVLPTKFDKSNRRAQGYNLRVKFMLK